MRERLQRKKEKVCCSLCRHIGETGKLNSEPKAKSPQKHKFLSYLWS